MYKYTNFKKKETTQSSFYNRTNPNTNTETGRKLFSFPEIQPKKYNMPQTNQRRENKARGNQRRDDYKLDKKPVQMSNSRLDKYKKENQEKQRASYVTRNTSSLSNYQRAPSNQFKLYLDDTENIFWENSWQVKKLKFLQFLKTYLIVLFIFLFSSYILIRGIQPWPEGQCPAHAQCAVFVHCNKGYIRQKNACFLDPAIKDKAKEIVNAVVQQLKIDYGARDCQSENFQAPTKGTRQIFSTFNVDHQQLKNEIYSFLEDPQNRVKMGFSYSSFHVTPYEKKHPLSCKIQLFIGTQSFYWCIIGIAISIYLIVKWMRYLDLKKSAVLAYAHLKRQLDCKDYILIEEHKKKIYQLVGQWSQQLWKEIDKLRYEQRAIVYFEQNDQLFWKMFKQQRYD